MKYEIRIFPRPGVLDQQGQAVAKALNSLGWPEVSRCRIGKIFEIDCDGDINQIAKQLYNEVMEDYECICLK